MTELHDFERTLAREIEAFHNGEPGRRRAVPIARPTQGLVVRLAVRRKPLGQDSEFTYHSGSISKLQARLEAERAAREAGWPIIGYVIDYTSA